MLNLKACGGKCSEAQPHASSHSVIEGQERPQPTKAEGTPDGNVLDQKGEVMLKTGIMQRMGSVLLGGVAMLAVLTACSGSAGANAPVHTANATPASVATGRPVPTPTSPPIATPTLAAIPAVAPATTSGGASGKAFLEQGKTIFEKTAGGMGCAFCHGLDAKGNGPAKVNAPDIRNKTEGDLRASLQGGVPMMTAIIKLSDEEIAAVMAYIHSLP